MKQGLAAVAAAFTVAMAMVLPAQAAPEPCKLGLVAELEVRISQGGAVAIPAQVANHDVWFALNTNNMAPALFQSGVAALGLTPKPIIDHAATGSHTRKDETHIFRGDKPVDMEVSLQSFTLGRATVGSWVAVVLPDTDRPLGYIDGKPIVGIMGTQLFKLVDVELDLANHKMRLFNANQCKDSPVYWGGEFTSEKLVLDANGAMHFVMELDGKNVDTGLLNGLRAASLDATAARQYYNLDEKSSAITHDEPGMPGASYAAMSLSAAGLNVRSARVRILDELGQKCGVARTGGKDGGIQYAKCRGSTPFSMGSAMVEKLRIYVAGSQEKIYISRATPAGAGDAAADGKAGATP
ncbi:MAG: hypothetical protein WDO12_06835 [Pseudomonadota bacterium]